MISAEGGIGENHASACKRARACVHAGMGLGGGIGTFVAIAKSVPIAIQVKEKGPFGPFAQRLRCFRIESNPGALRYARRYSPSIACASFMVSKESTSSGP